VWTLRGRAGADDAPEPIVPDGCAELLFNVGDPFEQVEAAGGPTVRQPLAMVVGPSTAPVTVRPTGAVDLVGVRLQPWAAACVLGLPVAELRGRVDALGDVTRLPALHELAERLAAAGAGEREARVSDALLRAARGGLTARSVQRLFATDVGLTPKELLRIARVQRALALARSAPGLPWAAIAARAGYYDQPHLVREFRALVGCPPSALRPEADGLTETFRDKSH
jgi:AraC-like DNA-binding protein